MERCAVICAIAALAAGPATIPAMADEACKAQVAAAFNKQRSSRVFTMASELKTPSGPVEIKVEYQPPDRMRQVLTAPGQEPLETVLYGQRAYSRQGVKWEELMPAVAQTIIAQVRAAVVDPPKEVGNFDCLGTTTLDGKEYLAYRSVEKQADAGAATGAPILHRTIYVDPKTGLPAHNIVAGDKADAETVFKAAYDYPEKLEIEDHPDAPLVKMR
jgi:outer membrane lipoprotein-sorting protein